MVTGDALADLVETTRNTKGVILGLCCHGGDDDMLQMRIHLIGRNHNTWSRLAYFTTTRRLQIDPIHSKALWKLKYEYTGKA